MRYPAFIKMNDCIGIPAPSFGAAIEPYSSALENALDAFRDLGFRTLVGANCYKADGIGRSTNAKDCAAELMKMYLGSEADALISCGGGELMCEILPYMDFEAIAKARPKWFLGYSDNTNFTFPSTVLADTAAVYGPCAPTFGMSPMHPALFDAVSLLKGEKKAFSGYGSFERESLKGEENPFAPYNTTEKAAYKPFAPAEEGGGAALRPAEKINLKGRLLGGCIDCLSLFLGTPWDKVAEFNKKYENDGVLWFLESCDLGPLQLRRSIWQMRQAGWFDKATGFIFGRPMHLGEEAFGLSMDEAVLDVLAPLGVPVLLDADLGHLPPQVPIVSGAKAKAEATAESWTIEYDFS